MNRALKVIQGHPYWCRQESRTVCCRNVQLMPTLFLKLGKIWQRETANSSISTTPLKFEDVPARNAFDFLLVGHCDYGRILHRFRDMVIYWLKIAYFATPFSFGAPAPYVPLGILWYIVKTA